MAYDTRLCGSEGFSLKVDRSRNISIIHNNYIVMPDYRILSGHNLRVRAAVAGIAPEVGRFGFVLISETVGLASMHALKPSATLQATASLGSPGICGLPYDVIGTPHEHTWEYGPVWAV